MRDLFSWDRTTVNFFRYVSQTKVPDTSAIWPGRHVVVYIPRRGAINPPFLESELIVSHMLPKELLLKPFGEPEAERQNPMKDLRGDRLGSSTLEERIENLEWLMGMAFRALEKLIKWYKRARHR